MGRPRWQVRGQIFSAKTKLNSLFLNSLFLSLTSTLFVHPPLSHSFHFFVSFLHTLLIFFSIFIFLSLYHTYTHTQSSTKTVLSIWRDWRDETHPQSVCNNAQRLLHCHNNYRDEGHVFKKCLPRKNGRRVKENKVYCNFVLLRFFC